MLSFDELNKAWERTLRQHAVTPLQGEDGPYRAIGDKSLKFLDRLWTERKAPLPDIGAMIEDGKTVRFWADPHYAHENILKLAARTEFRDVEEMDAVGHIHNRVPGSLGVNFSVENIGYEPRTLHEMLTLELLDDLVRRQLLGPTAFGGGDAPVLAPGGL